MGEVGCYTLHLYCDHPSRHDRDEYPVEFTGPTYGNCVRQARRAGWLVDCRGQPNPSPVGHGSGRCLCPQHNPRHVRAVARTKKPYV